MIIAATKAGSFPSAYNQPQLPRTRDNLIAINPVRNTAAFAHAPVTAPAVTTVTPTTRAVPTVPSTTPRRHMPSWKAPYCVHNAPSVRTGHTGRKIANQASCAAGFWVNDAGECAAINSIVRCQHCGPTRWVNTTSSIARDSAYVVLYRCEFSGGYAWLQMLEVLQMSLSSMVYIAIIMVCFLISMWSRLFSCRLTLPLVQSLLRLCQDHHHSNVWLLCHTSISGVPGS